MWVAYSNKGTKIEEDFWDWTCMHKVVTDYEEELGISEEEAYAKFWEDVKNYDSEDFEDCLRGERLDYAVGNGWFDELRADYLYSLNIECVKYVEIFLRTDKDLEELKYHLSMNGYNFKFDKIRNLLFVDEDEIAYVETILKDRDIIYDVIE